MRFKQLVEDRYFISKNANISYSDTGLMTPTERKYIIEFINRDITRQNEAMEKAIKKK